jgi:hypothetical protein
LECGANPRNHLKILLLVGAGHGRFFPDLSHTNKTAQFPVSSIDVGFWFLAGISIQEVNWRLETEPICLCGSDQERNGRVQPQPTEGFLSDFSGLLHIPTLILVASSNLPCHTAIRKIHLKSSGLPTTKYIYMYIDM